MEIFRDEIKAASEEEANKQRSQIEKILIWEKRQTRRREREKKKEHAKNESASHQS